MASDLSTQIDAATKRRAGLLNQENTEAVRLLHGATDGLDGLVIERFGPALIVQAHEGVLRYELSEVRTAVEALHQRLGTRAVYLKQFVRDRSHVAPDLDAAHRSAQPWIGEPVEEEVAVAEGNLRFLIRPYDGFSSGLFLEHRDNRRRVKEMANGKRVLNLFAYTCGFSVAAAVGGASEISSVDLSKRFLEWGKRNFTANQIGPDKHLFFCSDVFDFFKRAARQGRRFDLVIVDPPTFSKTRRPQRIFVISDDLPRLLQGAIELLEPGGTIVLSTNDRQLYPTRMEKTLFEAGGRRKCSVIERPVLPLDFAGDADYSKTLFARYA